MRQLAVMLALVVLALAACGDNPPPTQIVIVISPTPEGTLSADPATATTDGAATEAVTATTSGTSATPVATDTVSPGDSPRPTSSGIMSQPVVQPGVFPTITTAQLAVAQQVFEHGGLFWLRYNLQIWVMIASDDDPRAGDWFCYHDTFIEGEPETDPNLTPPSDALLQPRRGFGKLWRTHPDLQEKLGWAITPEFELTSNYTYIPGGFVQDGVYYPDRGEHRLTTVYNESVSFFESDIRGDCIGGTWKLTPQQ